ncbi:hypothetical protein HMPREF1508_1060 [Shuttleworthella sp. MSX8B]|uniref:Uncharacterized protein n=1 Tax=Shuttleworthella satelles DSM 14600 TaxID=626523 RepID=C4GAI8_9FIRM|nr:hypothetical protein GCWU000342_00940 [Shuttleworthia satelles DSM 14600]EUB13274.1 hypothetical protein HMPREF1508_1060 [Shuttleworthia sp. MSX8B]
MTTLSSQRNESILYHPCQRLLSHSFSITSSYKIQAKLLFFFFPL